jgi:predicted cobalt transporter CbtA
VKGEPRFGLAVDPRVVDDLTLAPAQIRTAALDCLAAVLDGEAQGQELAGALAGFRSVALDPRWRLAYRLRAAPSAQPYAREVFVAAVRPRARFDVYTAVASRLGLDRQPLSALAYAARARSPQVTTAPRPRLVPAPAPAPAKGPAR